MCLDPGTPKLLPGLGLSSLSSVSFLLCSPRPRFLLFSVGSWLKNRETKVSHLLHHKWAGSWWPRLLGSNWGDWLLFPFPIMFLQAQSRSFYSCYPWVLPGGVINVDMATCMTLCKTQVNRDKDTPENFPCLLFSVNVKENSPNCPLSIASSLWP